MPYQSNSRLADLILAQGQIAADRARNRGGFLRDAVRGLAALPDRIDARKQALAAAEMERRREESALANADLQRRVHEGTLAGQRRDIRLDDDARQMAAKTQAVQGWLGDVASNSDPAAISVAYQQGRNRLIEAGVLTPEDAPEFFPGLGWVKTRYARTLDASKQFAQMFPTPEEFTLNPGDVRFRGGQEIARVDPLPERPQATPNPTEASLAAAAAGGDEAAKEALRLLRAQNPPSARQGSGLTPNMEANVIRQLATQWTTASKPARDLERQVSLMQAGINAARRGDLAQGAQTILVTFQKILDPNSVVREAEFDRSAAGQSLMNRVKGAMDRLTVGGTGISLPELEKFAALAQEAADAQRGHYLQSVQTRIGRTADRYQIPRELVFDDTMAGDAGALGGAGTMRARDPQGNIHEAAAGTPLPAGWTVVN